MRIIKRPAVPGTDYAWRLRGGIWQSLNTADWDLEPHVAEAGPVKSLGALMAVRPGPGALVHAQDKAVMRARLDELGLPSPRHAVVASVEDVVAFGFPCVLKTTRGGYDGKGVWFVSGPEECAEPLRVAAETGVVMLIYLDHALVEVREQCSAEGRATMPNLFH